MSLFVDVVLQTLGEAVGAAVLPRPRTPSGRVVRTTLWLAIVSGVIVAFVWWRNS